MPWVQSLQVHTSQSTLCSREHSILTVRTRIRPLWYDQNVLQHLARVIRNVQCEEAPSHMFLTTISRDRRFCVILHTASSSSAASDSGGIEQAATKSSPRASSTISSSARLMISVAMPFMLAHLICVNTCKCNHK